MSLPIQVCIVTNSNISMNIAIFILQLKITLLRLQFLVPLLLPMFAIRPVETFLK